MAAELPKDAEGREIPLDTEILYGETGNEYEVYHYKYPVHRTIPWRKRQAVITGYIAHDVSDLYPTPPDSWEKLLEDLKAVEGYGNSPHLDNPACHYLKMAGKPCGKCESYVKASRIGGMRADIAYRTRGLRVRANE